MFTVEQLNSVQHVASRANRHVTLKQNPLRREHLQGIVDCYLPGKDRVGARRDRTRPWK
ncbi:hypothetical protein [Micromonospora haikouensis]|uniref:hypothetical protein n=1 Tax=Micromonospora haikouensis TaxID=686309 RepID=UPI00159F1F37|nr:hypothetical protein [Micromonospora haikouensis]